MSQPPNGFRTRHIDEPATLFDVCTNIIHDLEERQQTPQDDLVIQALMCLQAAVEIEHDQRRGLVGPRIGG